MIAELLFAAGIALIFILGIDQCFQKIESTEHQLKSKYEEIQAGDLP